MCSLLVRSSSIGTKDFTSLYLGVLIADKIGVKYGRPSVTILWTLTKVHRGYVDDIFELFRSKHHIEKFRNYLNRQHKNIEFTSETENRNSISFLDIKITRDNNKFMTSVYRKPTFGGLFTNFRGFSPKSYKYNLLFTLLHRAFRLCSIFERFHQKIDKLQTIFENKRYPKSFVDLCTQKVLRESFYKKETSTKNSKKNLFASFLFLEKGRCN